MVLSRAQNFAIFEAIRSCLGNWVGHEIKEESHVFRRVARGRMIIVPSRNSPSFALIIRLNDVPLSLHQALQIYVIV